LAIRDRIIKALIVLLLAVNIYLAAVQPCTSAEGVVYERYASHTFAEMWTQPLDPSLGLVYGILARIATRSGGVSELTIRVPAILGGLLFWISLSYACRRLLPGWSALMAFLVIAANPWTFRAFSNATGAALAVGLLAIAARIAGSKPSLASLLAGLAIGSDAAVALAAMAAASLALPFLRIGFWKWMDELLLPCLIPGLFLLLPALLVREKPVAASTSDRGTREIVRALIRHPRTNAPMLVGASSSIRPGLFFYRRRYHLDWIRIEPLSPANSFDVLATSDLDLARKLGLSVIQNTDGSILATRP
jgi:hypothetical protein